MSDPGDPDRTAPWIDDRSPRPGTSDDPSRIEAVPDAETVTFVERRDDAEQTAAWITADAALVVDIGDYS
ncbi:hypothetical protein [Halosimplex halobium]|uniref:hypothetical protein n=1 Tax=Halosimplex halobium TaxID=3396618 RepID=UPI003F574F41